MSKEQIEKLSDELSAHFAAEILNHPRIGAVAGGRWLGEAEHELESLIYNWLLENVRSINTSHEE